MFDFNRIGYNDLELILMYAANKLIDNLDEWKALLPLLGVCQQWTRILYPVVFHTAFIHYTQHSGRIFSRPKGWKSNIDCMAIRRCYNVAKQLEICIDIPADELLLLKNLEKLLQPGIIDWPQISSLYIRIYGGITKTVSVTPNKVEAKIVDFAQKLILHMPNIIDLQILQQHNGYALQSFSQTLVNAYALQLQRLHLWPVVTLPTTTLGSSLTYLNVCLYLEHDYDYNFSVFSDTLRVLRLLCLPFNTPWYMFYGNSRRGLINFKNLTKLVLSYHLIEYKYISGRCIKGSSSNSIPKTDKSPRKRITSIAESDYRYEIHFPKLKVLKVMNCFEEPDVINAKFGSTLDLFKLHGDPENIEKWTKIQLKSQRFRVYPTLPNGKYTAADTEILNNLFSKAENQCVKEFELGKNVRLYQLLSKSWNYLNILDVYLENLSQLLELLSCMPRLTKLICREINIDSTTMSIDEINQTFKLYIDTPEFALRLEELHLSAGKDLEDDNYFLAIVLNFITRAKLLTRLTVPRHIITTVQEIIDTQKAAYPHFANIYVDEYRPVRYF